MVTLKDVARAAKVSVATVSQVLNNKKNPLISRATREAVLKTAETLHYIPNRLARDLSRGSTMLLGVVIPAAANLFFPEVVEGIEKAASSKGYDIVLSYSAGNSQKERNHIQLLIGRKIDGLLIAPLGSSRNMPVFRELLMQKFPFVFVDRYLSGVETDLVASNLKEGAREAVSYLIRSGHTRIAHITEDSDISTASDVLKGYKKALMENGLKVDQELIETVNSETASNSFIPGHDGMRRFLDKKAGFTAVFCMGDHLAIGAIKALKEAKLRVPGDISVIGMDNLDISSCLTPSLTSVAQDRVQMGKAAGDILIKRIKNPKGKKKQIFLKTNLILRESVNKR